MESAVKDLITAIQGLRGDIQAAAKDTRALTVEQQRTTRELINVMRDFKDELTHLRHARERDTRIADRLDLLELAHAAGG